MENRQKLRVGDILTVIQYEPKNGLEDALVDSADEVEDLLI